MTTLMKCSKLWELTYEKAFLIIKIQEWVDPNTDIIELVRLGSHSELFGK